MSGFTDVFGGTALQPADVSYAALSLDADTALVWPPYYTGATPLLAKLMEVTASLGVLSISLPDATLASPGEGCFFFNSGALTFTIKDFSGNSLATVAAGTWRYVYILTNSTQAGTWRTTQLGTATSSPDASQLAGSGLKAVGATLVQAAQVSVISSSIAFSSSDRAKVYVNSGGGITGTLPVAASVGDDFFFELRNQGTGVMTVSASGGDTVDGAASISLQINESCFIHAGTGAWYTVGRGRNSQFNFSQLITATTGGTKVLSLSEAGNVVQTYTGALVSNQIVTVPAVVQVYYIINKTTGAFTFTVQCSGGGTSIVIPSGQNAVVFCDGTNIYNAATVVSGATSLLLGLGSLGAPALAIGASNNGFFGPSSTTSAVSAGGVEAIRWDGAQSKAPSGTAALPSYSFTAYPSTGPYAYAANAYAISTNGSGRLFISATGNVGIGGAASAFSLEIYKNQNAATGIVVVNNDAGASAGSYLQLADGLGKYANLGVNFAGNYYVENGAGGVVTKFSQFDTHTFQTNAGVGKFRIGSAGQVGVGSGYSYGSAGQYLVSAGAGAAPAWTTPSFAALASPAFTGVPTAPTAAGGTNTTQIATTAFVIATSLSSSLPSQAGNAGKYIRTDGTSASWATLSPLWQVKTSNYTAVAGDAILMDTTSGPLTLTLPATPAANDRIPFGDYADTWDTNNMTLGANGNKIHGTVNDMIFTGYYNGAVTYIDSTVGWKLTT